MALTYRSLRLSAALVAAVLVAIPWFLAVRALVAAEPVQPTEATHLSLVWSDRVFSSPRQLAEWLTSRGGVYRLWATRHPDARDTLEGRPSASESGPVVSPDHAPGSAKAGGVSTGHSRSWRVGEGVLRVVLLVLALLLAALAFAPRRAFKIGPLRRASDPERVRWVAFAVSLELGGMALLFSVVSP